MPPKTYNPLPEDKDIYDGEQRRETEFDSDWQKALQDGAGLYAKAKQANPGRAVTVADALDLSLRVDDDRELLRRAIAHTVREQASMHAAHERELDEFEGQMRFGSPEKVLTPDQKATLFDTFQRDFAAAPRSQDIPWPDIKSALEAAGEKALYGLNKMRANGHEVGVVRLEKDGRKGFRFDSCSSESPAGIRDIDYFDAEKIAESDWCVPLMSKEVFKELILQDIIKNKHTSDHLKSSDPGTRDEPGVTTTGGLGIGHIRANSRNSVTGFRCSVWIAEA